MTENLETTLMIQISTIVVAIIGAIAAFIGQHQSRQAKQHAADANREVTNDHKDNLRDDLDARFARIDSSLDHLRDDMVAIRSGLGRAEERAASDRQEARQTAAQLRQEIPTQEQLDALIARRIAATNR